ncbi:acetyl-CoA carboxylase biotin carboxylase subunit [Olsenella profusa DSM 13989]|uniref:biotin carboxylase n=1 Tax=Olsenella profusa F0195 TaxID=1125712 RepID=U2V2S6_9ACTN|nr:acetyl-CoA carboxylase biotin carboxylase subunit [Olsenella profusa]ERL06986.1 putative acetyl-CoA carboxylase, biotin carboxylase subunit [Olsenella profusa F0195]MDP9858405.1 acetyl-CoA carboxylase biotin carboxylase subunit [Olsenella profusa DSM 13989]
MFEKILIANRGEIAVRVIRACKEMGVQTVVVYSTADAGSYHVQIADEAWCIGGPRPADSYLNMDAIVTVAVESGATAVHPGYGFLSESSEFARKCRECGLVFIGPSPEVIDRMGDKDEARRTAKAAGVPIVEGTGLLGDADEAEREAKRIGFPLLIKARAGGGGRGIRKVEARDKVRGAFQEASSEAASAFGDGGCYMERFISPAHHVEVQVLGDAHGNVVSLGERECSVQRRNQKLLEESPSPSITPAVRDHMAKAARDLARSVGYVGLGTIEYLYSDANETFAFMEMNTRLQVEHPITEYVTGVDLVKWQMRVAAGNELAFAQDDIHVQGHAIECRLNAETPDFLPSCGTVETLHIPGGPWVRFDTALYQGVTIPPYYDSMLGKLIVYAPTREECVRKARSALGEFVVEGVSDNSELQLDILSNDEFVSGMYHTNLMEHLYE